MPQPWLGAWDSDALDRHYELDLVNGAQVRAEVTGLVRKLRAAAGWPRGRDAVDAVEAVGYALAEEGILTLSEAEWLAEALAVEWEHRPPSTAR